MTSADADPGAKIRTNFARMLRAKRVAVIGASERNPFSAPVIQNLERLGFGGEIILVNPRGEPINGRPVLRTVSELDPGIEAAFVCVPQGNVIDVVKEAAAAGVKGFVVVSSGFAETGAQGADQQSALAAVARSHGAALLGPNSLGFVNYIDHVPLSVLGRENRSGSLGIASVSGSVGGYLAKIAQLQGVGLSHMVLTGNEAGITIADVIEFLVDDPDTTAIAVFLEAVIDPQRFAAAARRALAARKPIVVLKAGASAETAKLVAAHTGALVGDDRAFNAVAAELGLCRVDNYEDLIATAVLLGSVGPVARAGVAAITISGGSGEVLSDLVDKAGVQMPPFSQDVAKTLADGVSQLGQTHNPLDLTGAALGNPGLWTTALTSIAADETIGLTLCLWDAPLVPAEGWMGETLRSIVRGYEAFSVVPPLVSLVAEPLSDYGYEAIRTAGFPGIIAGLKPAATALAHHAVWSRRVNDARPMASFVSDGTVARQIDRPRHDRALLERLAELGVTTVPAQLATDEEAAVRAAGRLGYPVALKLVAEGVAHKTEIGGVRLDITNADAVRAAFADIAAIDADPIDGVAVSPMRDLHAELLVAVTRDPCWGLMLTVGLGGIWVEVLDDVHMLALPTTATRIEQALLSLRAAPLLLGARGRPSIDLAPVAQAILRICEAAGALGAELELLEVNPLGISAAGVEALDALAIWKDA